MEFLTIDEPIDVRVILLEIDQEMFVKGHPFGIVDDIICGKNKLPLFVSMMVKRYLLSN
jgi:hypothetical protein